MLQTSYLSGCSFAIWSIFSPWPYNTKFSKAPPVDSCFISTLTLLVIWASLYTLHMLIMPKLSSIPWFLLRNSDSFSQLRQVLSMLHFNSPLKYLRGFQMNESQFSLPSIFSFISLIHLIKCQFHSSNCWDQTIWSQPWCFSFSHKPNLPRNPINSTFTTYPQSNLFSTLPPLAPG